MIVWRRRLGALAILVLLPSAVNAVGGGPLSADSQAIKEIL